MCFSILFLCEWAGWNADFGDVCVDSRSACFDPGFTVLVEFGFRYPVFSQYVYQDVVVCCDLTASSLNWFVRHFVSFVVVGIFFHVSPPLAVSAMIGFQCEVPVVCIPTSCNSVVVSYDFFNCEMD